MTRSERKRLDDRVQWLRARGHGTHDELWIWLAEVLDDLVARTALAEKRLLVLEHQHHRTRTRG
jgi:hypothetical protein